MEENQLGSAATGSGRLRADSTTLLDVVEQSSVAAAGDRLLVHQNSSFSAACLEDPQTTPKSSNALVEQKMERDTHNFTEKGS